MIELKHELQSKLYSPVEYKGTVKVSGKLVDVSRRVYQRSDIDFNYYDPISGMTNLERMKLGRPPFGMDESTIELHHLIQMESGTMVELLESTHEQYHKILHGLVGRGKSFRNNPLLDKQYKNFRRAYWKWRADFYESLEAKK